MDLLIERFVFWVGGFYMKEGVKSYLMTLLSPLNSSHYFFLHVYSLWFDFPKVKVVSSVNFHQPPCRAFAYAFWLFLMGSFWSSQRVLGSQFTYANASRKNLREEGCCGYWKTSLSLKETVFGPWLHLPLGGSKTPSNYGPFFAGTMISFVDRDFDTRRKHSKSFFFLANDQRSY